MAIKNLFPEEMFKSSGDTAMTLESIAGKLTYFHEQLHLLHWQTASYAEHKALGDLYEYLQDFKDDVVEKLMGYMGKKPRAFKVPPISEADPKQIVSELGIWSYSLYEWAGEQKYCDVENMAQELSGKAAKTKYLLSLT